MSFLLFFTICAPLAAAKVVSYNFDIGWVSAAPDGFTRPVIGINGQWPIPIIEANKGDTIVVNAKNSLGNESTSLHFHGQYQYGTNAYDGPVGVAQCPIFPGDSFTYTFKAAPPGTHWYHSHDKGQYPDGLRGLMIIHDPDWEASLDVDKQIYLSVSDWWHTQQPYLIHQYLSPENRVGDIPSPDTILVNDTRNAPDFTFEGGKRYLIRIANVGGLACNHFHIDGHVLTVVAIDGTPVHPKDTDSILICAGQRYDVVVTGRKGVLKSTKWIAKMTTDMMTTNIPPEVNRAAIGKVLYTFLGKILDLLTNGLNFQWVPSIVLDDFTLKPLDNTPLLKPVNQHINLRTNQTYYEGIGTRIGLGPLPWVEPKVPSLYTALTTEEYAFKASTYGVGVDPWILKSDAVVQVYMENPQPWPHPMHLHGHHFQVVARGPGSWSGNEAHLPKVPMIRDTVVVPANGYIVLRFRANNPGVWFFHCHIDFHLVGGMASTFIEAPEILQARQRIPDAGVRLCSNAGQCSNGNCACGSGPVSPSDSFRVCTTIFNHEVGSYGALITW